MAFISCVNEEKGGGELLTISVSLQCSLPDYFAGILPVIRIMTLPCGAVSSACSASTSSGESSFCSAFLLSLEGSSLLSS